MLEGQEILILLTMEIKIGLKKVSDKSFSFFRIDSPCKKKEKEIMGTLITK